MDKKKNKTISKELSNFLKEHLDIDDRIAVADKIDTSPGHVYNVIIRNRNNDLIVEECLKIANKKAKKKEKLTA